MFKVNFIKSDDAISLLELAHLTNARNNCDVLIVLKPPGRYWTMGHTTLHWRIWRKRRTTNQQ